MEEESQKKFEQFSMNAQEAFDIFQHPELRTNSHQTWLDDGKHDSKRRKIDEAAVCQTNWSYRMKKCVDASPIVVMQTGFTDIGKLALSGDLLFFSSFKPETLFHEFKLT